MGPRMDRQTDGYYQVHYLPAFLKAQKVQITFGPGAEGKYH